MKRHRHHKRQRAQSQRQRFTDADLVELQIDALEHGISVHATTLVHVMMDNRKTGDRLLNFWPSTGRWASADFTSGSGQTGWVDDWHQALNWAVQFKKENRQAGPPKAAARIRTGIAEPGWFRAALLPFLRRNGLTGAWQAQSGLVLVMTDTGRRLGRYDDKARTFRHGGRTITIRNFGELIAVARRLAGKANGGRSAGYPAETSADDIGCHSEA